MPAEDVDLVVTSPGWRPDQPMLLEAAARGIPVWGEVELAWRMRAKNGAAPWLTVTGTNGKTTTVNMLASILRAAGLRATSAGNVGTPILEAVLHPQPFDVIAVELSSFQLHWQRSVSRGRVGLPQRRARPPGLARLVRGVPAGQGPRLPAHPHRVRLQRRRPADRAAGHGGRGRRGLPGDRVHPRRPRDLDAGPRRRRAGRPRLRRDAPELGGRARHAARPPGRRAEHRPPLRGERAGRRRAGSRLRRRAVVGPRRAALLPSRPAPHRRRRDRRRASGSSTTPRPPTRTRRRRRCGRSTRSCGSPAVC